MNRLNVWRFALAGAVTFAALTVICAVAVIASFDATLAVFNTWFHGLDLRLLVPPGGRTVTAGQGRRRGLRCRGDPGGDV